MAKYKLLKEVIAYNYTAAPAPPGYVGGGYSVRDTVRFIIPSGTIIEATSMGFNQGSDPITQNSFQVELNTKYGKTFISNSVDGGIYLEQVDDSTPVTLDANIIPKDLSPSKANPNPNAFTPPTTKKYFIVFWIIAIAAIIALWRYNRNMAIGVIVLAIAYFVYSMRNQVL